MKIYVWLARLLLAVLVFMLVALVVRCSPTKRFLRLTRNNPGLIDSTTRHDTVHKIDTIYILSENPLSEQTVDSILSVYCDTSGKPAAVEKQKEIKKYIVDRCTHESLMGGKAKVFQIIGGTIILTAKGNEQRIVSDIKAVHTETTVYIPNNAWEEEKADMKKEHRRQLIDWILIALLVGFLSFPLLKLLIKGIR